MRVCGPAFQEEALDLLLRRRTRDMLDHERDRRFALDRVRGRHHRNVPNVGVLHEEVFNLLGIDVFATDVDHVIHATDEVVVPVAIPLHEVAGMEPAIPDLARRHVR